VQKVELLDTRFPAVVQRIGGPPDAGVRYHDVEPAEGVDGAVHEGLDIIGVTDIRLGEPHLAAGVGGHRIADQLAHGLHVTGRDRGAGLTEGSDTPCPYASCPTGDNCDFPIQARHFSSWSFARALARFNGRACQTSRSGALSAMRIRLRSGQPRRGDELQRRGLDLIKRGNGLKPAKWSDVSAHGPKTTVSDRQEPLATGPEPK